MMYPVLIMVQLLSQDDATIEQSKPSIEPATGPANEPGHGAENKTYISPKENRLSCAPRLVVESYGSSSARPRPSGHIHLHNHDAHSDWADAESPGDADYISSGGPIEDLGNRSHSARVPARPYYERQCARSLLLSNLAEGTTHADMTEAIRGGQLLDIYLRPHDRTAAVSFLQAVDAREFFDHVRRCDLYIRHKRVSARRASSQA